MDLDVDRARRHRGDRRLSLRRRAGRRLPQPDRGDQRRPGRRAGRPRRRHQERQHPLRHQLLRASSPATSRRFNDPLVYTPGDNEWTDCHRANNGKYDPLERLAALRAMFFPMPGLTLGGGRKPLLTPGRAARLRDLPREPAVVRGARRVRDLARRRQQQRPGALVRRRHHRTHDGRPGAPHGRGRARTAAAHRLAGAAFALAQQAATPPASSSSCRPTPGPAPRATASTAIVQRLAELARAFGKPVLVVQGDTHVYRTDSRSPRATPSTASRSRCRT